jgi:FkbM family methyltransferase
MINAETTPTRPGHALPPRASDIDHEFETWFARTCVPEILADARREALRWDGRPLAWEVCHEILAFQAFSGDRYTAERLIELSNTRYRALDALWPGGAPTREQIDAFYVRSAEILPWGHGVFQADHNVADRRIHWLRRVRLLEQLQHLGADSLVDYGAGGGHTTLLAKAMGFARVVHHEHGIFHPYVAWRAEHITSLERNRQDFVLTDAAAPLSLGTPVAAVVCTDVAEHVYSPDELLEQIYAALQPEGHLVWVSMFADGGISCHLHGHMSGQEETWLARHGFKRVADLPCHYQGHTGLYQRVAARALRPHGGGACVDPTPRTTGYPTLVPMPLGPEYTPRTLTQASGDVVVALGDLQLRLKPDRYLDRELIEGRLFERAAVGLMARLIRAGQTVVDVGANFGYITLLSSRWVGQEGRVIAFEPTREYGDRLQAHLSENRVSNVRVESLGLSDGDHGADICVGECSGTMHWTARFPPRIVERVQLASLDDWWRRYLASGQVDALDFVKIDVDGHELAVLRGARETLRRHRPALLVEFYKPALECAGSTCAALAEFLEDDLGYVIHDEDTGRPFASHAALLAHVDRPDRSFNVLCLPAMEPPAGVGPHQPFTSEAEVYLASADRMDAVVGNLARLSAEVPARIDTYATVIGGLSGLNYLLAVRPAQVVFFDLNPSALTYVRWILDVIRTAEDPRDFISLVFSRSVTAFLADTGEPELTVENQARYLARPIEEPLLGRMLSALTPEGRTAYERLVRPHVDARTLPDIRNCRRLLPCWPRDEQVPVGGGLAFGHNDAGQLVPNTNTFFYGLGWLASGESFRTVRQRLADAVVRIQAFDLVHDRSPELLTLAGAVLLHVSNIDGWAPVEWPRIVHSWQEEALAEQCRLTIVSSQSGLTVFSADPHTWAYRALAPHVTGRVVEVTHKAPWGFDEFARTNVTVSDYLGGTFPADTTILHILCGEGVEPATFEAACRKAFAESWRVIVLEHNRESADWGPSPPPHFVSETELRDVVLSHAAHGPARLTTFRRVVGEKDDRRNLMLIMDRDIVTTGPRRPRVLLIADVPNWVFAEHCHVLVERLSDEFDFAVRYGGEPFVEDDYDLIYPLEWNLVDSTRIACPDKYVAGIRSHVSWARCDFQAFASYLTDAFQKTHAVSRRLHRLLSPFVPGLRYLSHGVDTRLFTPRPRVRSSNDPVRIGWAGNRAVPAKGFDALIAPLARVPGVELVTCGFGHHHHLTRREMPEFYQGLDIYLCASGNEGNNNSLLEAAAIGCAIVTTDNGTVPEYLRHESSALIVDREFPAILGAVQALRDDPDRRERMGEAARQAVVEHFSWDAVSEHYRAFFREALADSGRRRSLAAPLRPPAYVVPDALAEARAAAEAREASLRHALAAAEASGRAARQRATLLEEMGRTLAPTVISHGLKEVTVYGAGEAGQALAEVLTWHGIRVTRFVDRDPAKIGRALAGVPVISLATAVELTVGCFVVGSVAFADEIRRAIEAAHEGTGRQPLILAPGFAAPGVSTAA